MDWSFVWTRLVSCSNLCFVSLIHYVYIRVQQPQIEDFVLIWYSPPYVFHVSYIFCSTKLILCSTFFILVNK
jgi:hypothetical protein